MEFINFIMAHWVLSLAFVIVFALLMLEELKQQKDILNTQQLVSLINNDKATILDIRKQDDFASGHIKSAINIPLAELKSGKSAPKTDKTIVIIGASPMQEKSAARIIRKQGHTNLQFLRGSLNSWTNANMPLERSKK